MNSTWIRHPISRLLPALGAAESRPEAASVVVAAVDTPLADISTLGAADIESCPPFGTARRSEPPCLAGSLQLWTLFRLQLRGDNAKLIKLDSRVTVI